MIWSRNLACGARLVVEPIPGLRSASLSWLTPAGYASDPPDRQGMSGLWSELVLRGAGALDSRAQADALDQLGVNRAVDAGAHFLRVGATMIGDRLADTLPLIADMVLRPRFDEASIEPARDLARRAVEALKGDREERASLACRARHAPPPFDRSGLGIAEHLIACTREDLVRGWAVRARPAGSIIGVAGAVEPEQLARDLDRLLAGWTGIAPDPVTSGSPPRGYAHLADETNQVQIVLMHDAPSERDPDSLLERIVDAALSGGMSGRLFTEVREKRGLCYTVASTYAPSRDFGTVVAYVGTAPERAQESLDVLGSELSRLATPEGRLTPGEFDRAVVGMKSRLVFAGESSAARAYAIAVDHHRLGRSRTLEEMASAIDRITLADVNSYLARRAIGVPTIQTLGPAPLTPPAFTAGV